MQHSSEKLGTDKLSKLILTYSVPSVIGTVVMSLYNIVDRIFIGQGVGPLAISGLTLTFPFMILLMACGMLIGAGSASRISITLGEKNLVKAEKILGNAMTLTLIISGGVSLITLIFMDQILTMFGGTAETIQYAREYMQIIVPASVISAINFGFNNIMRASGFPRKAMQTMLIGAVANILLDALFILVFEWGIRGAAFATVISYLISSAWVVNHFRLPASPIHFKKSALKLEKDIVKSILSIGFSPFSMQVATSLVVILINSTLMKHGGDLAIGAYGIINSLLIFIVMIVLGLNQGTQPIVGYNYGAKQYDRVFRTVKISAFIATGLTTIGFLLGMFFDEISISLFTRDPELKAIATNALRITIIMFPLVGFQIVLSNFFQSIGKAKIAIFLSLTRQFIILIPSLLILPEIWQLNGAWAAMPVSDGLSAVVSAITFYIFYINFKRL